MHKILLLGKFGQVGNELTKILSPRNLIAFGKNDLDIRNSTAVNDIYNIVRPEIVINAAAYNNVDEAELQPDLAMQINASANEYLAKLSASYDALYITYSSDFVFDGRSNKGYLEIDTPNPINKYGESKLKGDIAVQNSGANSIILRTSSVFSRNRPCFLTKIISQSKNKSIIPVRSDLISCPTSAVFIAEATAFLIKNYGYELYKYSGLYNLCSSGFASRYQWAKAIQGAFNLDVEIVSGEFFGQEGAARPLNSSLNNSQFQSTFNIEIPDWEKMIYALLDEQ